MHTNLLASVSSHWFIFFQKYKKVMFLCCLQATLPFWKPIEANSCQQKIPAQLVHHWCWDFYWTTSELHIDNLFLEVIFWTGCPFKLKPEGGGCVSFLLDILSGVLANTISDTSYIPITQGTLCLSVIRDLFDLSIVAYKTSTRQSIKLVLDTIRTAIEKEEVTAELLLHSDQGFQYASQSYFALTTQYGITPSM